MAQNRLSVGASLAFAAGGFALLAERPPVGDFLEELLADALGGDGVRQRVRRGGRFAVEQVIDALDCVQRLGRGGVRVEIGGHVGVSLIVDGESRGGGFAAFVRLGYQNDRHFERDGFGERGGDDGGVLAVKPRVRLVRVRVGERGDDADGFGGRIRLLGANPPRLRVCVLAQEIALQLRGFRGHADAPRRDFGNPRFADESPQDVLRRFPVRNGGADFARVLVSRLPPLARRGRGYGGRLVVHRALDFGKRGGAGFFGGAGQQSPLGDQRQAFVRDAAPEDMPDVAVGQDSERAGPAGMVGAQVSANLVHGLAVARRASAGQVMSERLGFQNGNRRTVAREHGGRVVQNDVRSVVPRLQFAPLMRGGKPQKRQRRVDELQDGVFLAVIAETDKISAVGEQRSCGIGGVGHDMGGARCGVDGDYRGLGANMQSGGERM